MVRVTIKIFDENLKKEIKMESKFKRLKDQQSSRPAVIKDDFDVTAGCSASCGSASCSQSCGATCNSTCITSATSTKPVGQ